jgi:hypothetical protein
VRPASAASCPPGAWWLLAFLGVLPAVLGFAAPELFGAAVLWDALLALLALLDRSMALGARLEVRRYPRGRLPWASRTGWRCTCATWRSARCA